MQGLSCHCGLTHITIYFSNLINSPDYKSEILTSSIVGYLTIYLGFLVILNFNSECSSGMSFNLQAKVIRLVTVCIFKQVLTIKFYKMKPC